MTQEQTQNINESFYPGQIFIDTYPPEAADFCNNSGGLYFIAEIEKEGEHRRFQIQNVPAPTREELLARLLPAVQQALDAFVRTRGYDNIVSCCSYATSSNDYYRSEGLYACDLRDRTWEDANSKYATLEADESLPVPEPTDFVATLPVAEAEWPVLNTEEEQEQPNSNVQPVDNSETVLPDIDSIIENSELPSLVEQGLL